MNSNFFLSVPIKAASLLFLFLLSQAMNAETRHPNIVLIITDDQGYADLYANQTPELQATALGTEVKAKTPAMDDLIKRGTRLTSHYSTASTCSPSRAAIMTGKYQQSLGFWDAGDSRGGLDENATTIADILSEKNYYTGFLGKWHLGDLPRFSPRARGFHFFYGFLSHGGHDYYNLNHPFKKPTRSSKKLTQFPTNGNNMYLNYSAIEQGENEYLTDHIGNMAVDFIEKHKNYPYFLTVAFNAVHGPAQPPKSGNHAVGLFANKRDILLGMLGSLDDNIQKIVNAINTSGQNNNTLILFMGDNGGAPSMEANNAPLRGFKHDMFEGGIRVPGIAVWPGVIPEGKTFDKMTMGFDMFPTILDAAGFEIPPGLDGKSLLPYLKGEQTGEVHDVLVWDENMGPLFESYFGKHCAPQLEKGDGCENPVQFHWNAEYKHPVSDAYPNHGITIEEYQFEKHYGEFAVRKGNWKLVQMQTESNQWPRMFLFNLANDIGEQNNLIGSEAAKAKELKQAYLDWHSRQSPQPVAVRRSSKGCLDPRFAEYPKQEKVQAKVTRHSVRNCLTMLQKAGCMDDGYVEFDMYATISDANACKTKIAFTPILTRSLESQSTKGSLQ